MDKLLKNVKMFTLGITNSYSQIFFSNKLFFSIILVLVSFIDVYAGISGLVAVLVSNLTAIALGFDLQKISGGIYGFNSLLVGLGLGIYFQPGWPVFIVLILISIFTFFITVMLEGVIGKYSLPFLSIPFIIGIWTVTLATKEFQELIINENGVYIYNELYRTGGQAFIDLYDWWNNIPLTVSLKTYFMSLGAIFFQYNILAGILIATALFFYSRIAFSLSLLGFYSAYIFYLLMGINISEISYANIGFNYILTAIAIGGFFIIPNYVSYIWTIVLVPLVGLVTISMSGIFNVFHLPVYSLPFNIIVILFLYVLKLRISLPKNMVEVPVQQFSPEKNLYFFKNNIKRFGHKYHISLKLPFTGEWVVTQAHNGKYTHKGDWQHAWDFEIYDNNNKSFKNEGKQCEDYFCYNKPVISPFAGTVEEIIDDIKDNEIGEVNINDNWGNTIVIKHTVNLYSKLSHLKAGSFKVKKGDYVKQGQILATCGNSGRSPYPHLHFQLQSTPYVGSKTIDYPISNYIVAKNNKKFEFISYNKPKLNEKVRNIEPNKIISNAFGFVPGQKLRFVMQGNNDKIIEWEIQTDAFNNAYIYCKKTKSYAYFYNDNTVFYFKNFVGKRSSLLYDFYIAAYKIQFGFYKDIQIKDSYPLHLVTNRFLLLLQDIVAPFVLVFKAGYKITFAGVDDENWPSTILLKSSSTSMFLNKKINETNYTLQLNNKGINKFTFEKGNKTFTAKCVG